MSLDLLHIVCHYWLKPSLAFIAVLAFVQRPSFRSAENYHSILFIALVAVFVLTFAAVLLPSWPLALLPSDWMPLLSIQLSASSEQGKALLYGGVTMYLLGVSWIGCYTVMSLREAWRLSHNSHELGGELSQRIEGVKQKLAANFSLQGKVIEIRVSDALQSPMMWRHRKPQILLPKSAARWEDARLLRVLAHEYAHIERSDWLTKLLCRFIASLFWYIPLVWRINARIQWYAEVSCDDRVVQWLDCRADYADDLLDLSTDVRHSAFTLGYLQGSELYRRIQMVLDPCRQKTVFKPWQKMLLFLFSFGMFFPLATGRLEADERTLSRHATELFPLPTLIPQLVVLDESPLASYEQRVAWLNRQLELQAVEPAKAGGGSVGKVVKPLSSDTAGLSDHTALYKHRIALRDEESVVVSARPQLQPNDTIDGLDVSISAPAVSVRGYIPTRVVTPEYPRRALIRNVSGRVIVQFDVDERGRVQRPRIIQAQPSKLFDRAVLSAIEEFRFTPLIMDGKPVITKNVTETFIFEIKGNADEHNRGA